MNLYELVKLVNCHVAAARPEGPFQLLIDAEHHGTDAAVFHHVPQAASESAPEQVGVIPAASRAHVVGRASPFPKQRTAEVRPAAGGVSPEQPIGQRRIANVVSEETLHAQPQAAGQVLDFLLADLGPKLEAAVVTREAVHRTGGLKGECADRGLQSMV
jgi:hypothetical protein